MKATTKLVAVNTLAHISIIPAVIYGQWWHWVLAFLWWQVIATTSISSGYHRYFSHNAFSTGRWYEYYAQFLGIFANAGPAITWASSHRMHHAYSDTDRDPHSPKFKGFFTVYTNFWGYSVEIDRKFLKNLSNRPSLVFFYRNYFKLMVAVALAMLIIDPMFLLFGMAMPMVFAFHGYGLINAWTHRGGSASNSILANLLTAGEGYHKFHHEDGKNWRIGRRWYHFDLGAWFIKLIKTDNA